MRIVVATAVLLGSLLLAACASGQSEANEPMAGDEEAAFTAAPLPPNILPAPATDHSGQALVDQPVAAASTSDPGVVNTACTTDADCAVKDVGNCCGYYPACVNKDSPTFPEQVKAECAKNDMMSTCGFREISSCACVSGRCEASSEGEGAVR